MLERISERTMPESVSALAMPLLLLLVPSPQAISAKGAALPSVSQRHTLRRSGAVSINVCRSPARSWW